MRKQFINGKVYDWSSVTIKASGCEDIEPTSIEYGDSYEKNLIKGRGGRLRGWGRGKRDNSVKLVLLREDYNTLMDSFGKDFYDLVIPKVTVSYADSGATTCTDIINNLTFSKRDFSAKEDDDHMEVSIEGIAVGGITTG